MLKTAQHKTLPLLDYQTTPRGTTVFREVKRNSHCDTMAKFAQRPAAYANCPPSGAAVPPASASLVFHFRFRLHLRGFFRRAANAQLNSKRRDSPSQSPCSNVVVITTDPRQARKKRAGGCLGAFFWSIHIGVSPFTWEKPQKIIEAAMRDTQTTQNRPRASW